MTQTQASGVRRKTDDDAQTMTRLGATAVQARLGEATAAEAGATVMRNEIPHVGSSSFPSAWDWSVISPKQRSAGW